MADQLNPDELLEILNISSQDLIESFEYKIEEQYEDLIKEYGDEETSEESEDQRQD